MTRSLQHRGPDGRGTWSDDQIWLGHTRLSIIDLSDAAAQPMCDAERRFVIVFNGEIYNYIELRRELMQLGHLFRTHSDTEVLLTAYLEWGEGCLDRLEGMWAFAIWDSYRRVLFAARDRVGKKPFYFVSANDGTFVFASEIRALRLLGLRLTYNPQAAFDFLTQGTYGHLGGATFVREVQQLPAAHKLRLEPGGKPRVERYWNLPSTRAAERLPYDESARVRFRELLEDAVRIRLRADVPVGATLSGGIDSSAIVGLMQREMPGRSIHVFTRQFPGTPFDESRYVDDVVGRMWRPIVHRAVGSSAPDESTLFRVLDHQEEPFGDTSIIAHFELMQLARGVGVPVILSGQGGDELMLGYPSLVNAYLGSLLAEGRVHEALQETTQWCQGRGQPIGAGLLGVIPHAFPLRLRDLVRRGRVAWQARIVSNTLRQSAQFGRFDLRNGESSLDSYVAQVFRRFALPHLTQYDDRNAMAFGVEGRMPFLDRRVVEFMFRIDYAACVQNGRTKRILRESCSDVLTESVLERRDKIGFFTPLGAWLRRHRSLVVRVMSREFMEYLHVLEPARYYDRLDAFFGGDVSAELAIWRGFVFHLWASQFGIEPPERRSDRVKACRGVPEAAVDPSVGGAGATEATAAGSSAPSR